MKISIDTKEDSKEELRKVIRMLAALVGEEEVFTNEPPKHKDIFSDEAPSESPGSMFGNLFGGDPAPSTESTETKEETEEKKDDGGEDEIPEVEIVY